MSSVHRICPRCGESYPVDTTECPCCGHSTNELPAVSGRPSIQALLRQVTVPVALGAISLAMRASIRLFQHFLRDVRASSGQLGVAQESNPEIVIHFWGRREIIDHQGRSVREQTRARWEIRRR